MTDPLPLGNRNYVSTFAGIGGFDIALEQAGWECHTRVEIDDHCNRVTAGWLPGARSKRDVRKTSGRRFQRVGLVCGGFPCQDLSVAGKRKGLAGKRSGLFHELVRIVAEARPRWLLWENVPGLLSSNDGRDFWTVNAALAEVGYFGAWRVLDSQHFGVAQRRRRVFGLYAEGYLGVCRAAAVLLEPQGGGWHPAQGGGARQGDYRAPAGGADGTGVEGQCGIAPAVTAKQAKQAGGPAGDECQNLVQCFVQNTRDEVRLMNGDGNLAGALSAEPGMKQQNYLASSLQASMGHHGHSSPRGDGNDNLIPVAFCERSRDDGRNLEMQEDLSYALTNPGSGGRTNCGQILAPTLSTKNEVASSSTQREAWMQTSVDATGTVRRLTPTECERLQGFPVGWTIPRDKWTGWTLPKGLDSARYRACGNAVTTNVIYWIALRINMVEDMIAEGVGA